MTLTHENSILHPFTSSFGGIERVLSIKANYLADVYGYDIHIITADLKGASPAFRSE